jgi:hypothetical protein
MKTATILSTATAVVLLAGSASAQTSWEPPAFQSPTGNIACVAGQFGRRIQLRCMTRNDGFTIALMFSGHSRARRIGDYSTYVRRTAAVLPYGHSRLLYLDSFRCSSRISGVTCRRSPADGHGFFISLKTYRIW